MPKKSFVYPFVLVVFCLLTVWGTAQAQRKPRVAVLAFSGNEGQRITDWAVVKLGENKEYYTLIERDKGDLAKVIEEIEKTQKGLFDDPTRVPFGKLQGVEILVMGKVDTAKVDRPRLTKMLGGAIGGAVSRGKWTSQVKLLVKLIKAATGEIVETLVVEGKAEGKDMMSTLEGKADEVFSRDLLGKATNDAVGKFVAKLQDMAKGLQMPAETKTPIGKGNAASPVPSNRPEKSAEPVRTAAPVLTAGEGIVVDVDGATVSIYLASTAGLRNGEKWKIRRLRKEITDPTGKVIGKLYDDLGEVTITEIQPQMLVGSYAGAKPALKNDAAVKVPTTAKPPLPRKRP